MKLYKAIALLIATLFIFGCATSETASTTGEAPSGGDSAESDASPRAKTAYEGSTGSGLLMERYKSGEISGFRKPVSDTAE